MTTDSGLCDHLKKIELSSRLKAEEGKPNNILIRFYYAIYHDRVADYLNVLCEPSDQYKHVKKPKLISHIFQQFSILQQVPRILELFKQDKTFKLFKKGKTFEPNLLLFPIIVLGLFLYFYGLSDTVRVLTLLSFLAVAFFVLIELGRCMLTPIEEIPSEKEIRSGGIYRTFANILGELSSALISFCYYVCTWYFLRFLNRTLRSLFKKEKHPRIDSFSSRLEGTIPRLEKPLDQNRQIIRSRCADLRSILWLILFHTGGILLLSSSHLVLFLLFFLAISFVLILVFNFFSVEIFPSSFFGWLLADFPPESPSNGVPCFLIFLLSRQFLLAPIITIFFLLLFTLFGLVTRLFFVGKKKSVKNINKKYRNYLSPTIFRDIKTLAKAEIMISLSFYMMIPFVIVLFLASLHSRENKSDWPTEWLSSDRAYFLPAPKHDCEPRESNSSCLCSYFTNRIESFLHPFVFDSSTRDTFKTASDNFRIKPPRNGQLVCVQKTVFSDSGKEVPSQSNEEDSSDPNEQTPSDSGKNDSSEANRNTSSQSNKNDTPEANMNDSSQSNKGASSCSDKEGSSKPNTKGPSDSGREVPPDSNKNISPASKEEGSSDNHKIGPPAPNESVPSDSNKDSKSSTSCMFVGDFVKKMREMLDDHNNMSFDVISIGSGFVSKSSVKIEYDTKSPGFTMFRVEPAGLDQIQISYTLDEKPFGPSSITYYSAQGGNADIERLGLTKESDTLVFKMNRRMEDQSKGFNRGFFKVHVEDRYGNPTSFTINDSVYELSAMWQEIMTILTKIDITHDYDIHVIAAKLYNKMVNVLLTQNSFLLYEDHFTLNFTDYRPSSRFNFPLPPETPPRGNPPVVECKFLKKKRCPTGKEKAYTFCFDEGSWLVMKDKIKNRSSKTLEDPLKEFEPYMRELSEKDPGYSYKVFLQGFASPSKVNSPTTKIGNNYELSLARAGAVHYFIENVLKESKKPALNVEYILEGRSHQKPDDTEENIDRCDNRRVEVSIVEFKECDD